MLLIKKGKFNNKMTTEIFKCYKNCTFFDAQNDGNHISELLGFKFFWGGTYYISAGIVPVQSEKTTFQLCNQVKVVHNISSSPKKYMSFTND